MTAIDRLWSVPHRLRSEGPRAVGQRLARLAYRRLGAGDLEFPLLSGDVADSTRLKLSRPRPMPKGAKLRVGWLTTPPGEGSGGHTTMFRMIKSLEDQGHECFVLLYDRHNGDPEAHARVIRSGWPWVSARVLSAQEGLRRVDACVATSWQTAHVLASRNAHVHSFYFIQDYEPFFHAHGSEYELAADTYRFGFTNIALGNMVQNRLRKELGVASELVPFSCDTKVYTLENRGPRTGIAFYAKPDVPRRGFRLAAAALTEFHARHPHQEIHVYGDATASLGMPVTRHGRMTPQELNMLYNQSIAGLALSFTNISLVAEEMLAAGCIPVVNESADSRADLVHPAVHWCSPTQGSISDALSRAVESASKDKRLPVRLANHVRSDNWRIAGSKVVRIIESGCTTQ